MGVLVASPLKDKPFHDRWPRLERTSAGWTATTWWWVPTSDPYLAVTAPGIPAIGELYTPELPSLKCTGHSTEWRGGELTFVRASYDEGQGGTFGPPPPPEDLGVRRSEVENGTATQTIRQDIAGADIIGEPVSVLVGTCTLTVYAYCNWAQADGFLTAFLASCGTLNQNTLFVPPRFAGAAPFGLAPRTALLENVTQRVTNQAKGIIESATRLQVKSSAAAWKHYALEYNAEGVPWTGMEYDVYRAQAWGALW